MTLDLLMDKGPLWIFFIGVLYFAYTSAPRLMDKLIEYRKERDAEYLKDRAQERERYQAQLQEMHNRHALAWEQRRIDDRDREQRMDKRNDFLFNTMMDHISTIKAEFSKVVQENTLALNRLFYANIAHNTLSGHSKEELFREMRDISGENITKEGDIAK